MKFSFPHEHKVFPDTPRSKLFLISSNPQKNHGNIDNSNFNGAKSRHQPWKNRFLIFPWPESSLSTMEKLRTIISKVRFPESNHGNLENSNFYGPNSWKWPWKCEKKELPWPWSLNCTMEKSRMRVSMVTIPEKPPQPPEFTRPKPNSASKSSLIKKNQWKTLAFPKQLC